MQNENPYLSVIIPAYNEEKRIPATLERVNAWLSAQSFSWEVMIVLDGCADDTIGVVTRFAEGKNGYRWIDRAQNRGKGYSVREGILAATGKYRLFMDADNSTDIDHFDLMQPLLEAGNNIIIASRDSKDVKGAKQAVPQPFLKRLLGDLGNLFIQVVAVPGIWDTQCGFKLFDEVSAEAIFSKARVDGWVFDIEALALARRHGYKLAIIPANWINDEDTHVSISHYASSLLETIRIRWYLLSGAYR